MRGEGSRLNVTTGAFARPLSQFLRLAVVTGISRAVQVHIDRGDDLNARDGKGQTPLMLAAARNKVAICKLLLDAGADGSLQDPAGKTAHDIAIAASAQEAAAVIAASQFRFRELGPAEFRQDVETAPRGAPSEEDTPDIAAKDGGNPAPSTAGPAIGVVEPTTEPGLFSSTAEVSQHGEELAQDRDDTPVLPTTVGNEQIPPGLDQYDDLEFDLSGWVAEEESVVPTADPTIAVAAVAIQTAISLYTPIDSFDEWDDIDAFLPDRSTPLSRAADTETRSHLRALLLRAIRECVISDREIEELSTDEDGSPNSEAHALLLMVVNDLGADVDNWLGPNPSQENANHDAPAESTEEEALLDEAFSFIDAASSHRNEPLRTYQREFQSIPLITAEEEISLAQTMERSLEAAMDALAGWPTGITRTLSAGAEVTAGLKPTSWMSRGDVESDPEGEGEGERESGAVADTTDDSEEDIEDSSKNSSLPSDPSFAKALKSLEVLGARAAANTSEWGAVRAALSELNLSRGFLLELADISDTTLPEVRTKYLQAVAEYLKARDAMVCANLKLSFHIAKKYLYSGVPLDDLTQEANLGLLKAVDKYDWRRGFKFSTYATWWIRQQVSRHVADKNRTIRVPVHIFEKLQRVRRAADDFEAAHGRPAKAADIAELVGMPMHKTAGLMRLLPEPVSLQDISIDELITVGAQDALTQEDPMEIASASELSTAVRSLLGTLDIKESQVLCLRYGIGDQEPMTLDEVGRRYGVTRERIRQIESKLLRRLQTAVQFAREAISVDNSEVPRRRRASRGSENIEDLLAKDNAEADQDVDSPDDETAPSREQAPDQTQKSSVSSAKRSRPSPIDAMLALASELGIPYDDDRNGSSGRVWISFTDAPDGRHRKLARKLLDNGFAYWPGKGFWR